MYKTLIYYFFQFYSIFRDAPIEIIKISRVRFFNILIMYSTILPTNQQNKRQNIQKHNLTFSLYFLNGLQNNLQLIKCQIMNQCIASEFTVSKKQLQQKKYSSKDQIQREGRWNSQQNLKYLVFLCYNQSKFECKKKRMFRLYKPLSKFIGTRNSQQCRSHHRKLLLRFKTPKNIIQKLRERFTKQEIDEQEENSIQKLQLIDIPEKKIWKKPKKFKKIKKRVERQKTIINQQNEFAFYEKMQVRTTIQPQIRNEQGCITDLGKESQNYIERGEVAHYHQALKQIAQLYYRNYNYYCNPYYFPIWDYCLPNSGPRTNY